MNSPLDFPQILVTECLPPLCAALETLTVRAQHAQLFPPRSAAELAAWLAADIDRQAALDESVRQWLHSQRWPENLPPRDAALLLVRIRSAMHWTSIATCLGPWHVPHTLASLLRVLLIDAWPSCRELWEIELGRCQACYLLGFDAAIQGQRSQPPELPRDPNTDHFPG